MPSVINTNLTSSSAPSELDFVADDAVYFNSSPNSTKDPSSSARTVQDLKDSNRRRWSDPEDEFSVPIYTEHPLITKKPLNMSSFLLNYRAMHRSIEIMTPPAMQINDEAMPTSSMTTSPLHPTIPDGPIYIHHRSTTTGCALSNVTNMSKEGIAVPSIFAYGGPG
ncbi:hypothetical protein BGZ54_000269 [Gamsiella multidivaricata]|nr:hypothetical protein BGZ54_000269 [Gamsiella multidivaricata]